MELYAATDLHSSNNHLGIIDKDSRRIFKKRLPNIPQMILEALKPYKKGLVGIVNK
jgi:hypothetical protein